jgi:hypothetical protein
LGAMFLRGSPAAAAAASSASGSANGSASGSVPKDEARAAELFATGVALDSTECILALAMCYLRGAVGFGGVDFVLTIFRASSQDSLGWQIWSP